MVSQTSAATPPLLSVKNSLSQSKDRPHKGGIAEKLASEAYLRHRRGTPKNLCNKDFAELSGKLSGAICLKTPVLLVSALELFTKFFGAVRAIFGFWGSFWASEACITL